METNMDWPNVPYPPEQEDRIHIATGRIYYGKKLDQVKRNSYIFHITQQILCMAVFAISLSPWNLGFLIPYFIGAFLVLNHTATVWLRFEENIDLTARNYARYNHLDNSPEADIINRREEIKVINQYDVNQPLWDKCREMAIKSFGYDNHERV